MAQLTWREVAAPDFSNSMNGIKAFGDTFDRAIGQARSTIGDLDQAQTDRFNKGMLLTLAGLQDPTAAKTAIPELLARAAADPNRTSLSTLAAINARPGELLSQATQQQNFDKTSYDWSRRKLSDTNQDAANPIVNQVNYLRSVGKDAEAQKLLEGHLADLSKPGVDFTGLLRDSQGLASSNQSYIQGKTNFERSNLDWNENRQAIAAMQDVIANADTPEAAERYLSTRQLDPNVLARVRSGLQLAAFPTFTPDPSFAGGSGMSPNGDDPRGIMNYQARNAGFGAVPANVQTLGQASAYADSVNRSGVPSSAMGPFQMVGNTQDAYAKRLFGANWKDVPYTVQNQDKLAKALFQDNNASNEALVRQWPSLAKLGAGGIAQVRQMPWEQARNIIMTHEVGAQAAANARALLETAGDAAGRDFRARDQVGSVTYKNNAVRFAQAQTDPREAPEVAVELMKTFPGVSRDTVLSNILQIQERAQAQGVPLRPAAAADILRTTAKPRGMGTRFLDKVNPFIDGESLGYNSDLADELILKAKPGRDGMSENERVVRGVTVIQANQAQQNQASQALSQSLAALAQGEAAVRAGRKVDLAPLRDRVSKAQAMIQGAIDAPAPVPVLPQPSRNTVPASAPKPAQTSQRKSPQQLNAEEDARLKKEDPVRWAARQETNKFHALEQARQVERQKAARAREEQQAAQDRQAAQAAQRIKQAAVRAEYQPRFDQIEKNLATIKDKSSGDYAYVLQTRNFYAAKLGLPARTK